MILAVVLEACAGGSYIVETDCAFDTLACTIRTVLTDRLVEGHVAGRVEIESGVTVLYKASK